MNNRQANIIAYTVAALTTAWCFSAVLLAPGSVMMGAEGDAAKNYFTFLYHVAYGNGIWFDGMNYPFGEHIVFTDAQPVFAVPLSWLHRVFAFNPLVVFHLLIVCSFFLAIVYLYKILARFALPSPWAITGAVVIAVMSPQVFKLNEHYSLAYFCILPMLFCFNLAWLQEGKTKYAWYLGITSLVSTFLHPYFALMYGMWIAAYSLGYVLFFRKSIKAAARHLYPLWLAIAVPVLLFVFFISITDTVTDRPGYPYGARWNRTFAEDIYTSCLSPISKILKPVLAWDKMSCGSEGYTYIGIAPLIVLIVGAIIVTIRILARRPHAHSRSRQQGIGIWMFIALPALVFGTSFIFTYCFVCLDYAAFIKQFRAVGRVSWIYYYIATVVAVVGFYRWQSRLPRWLGNAITLLLFSVWVVEAYGFTKQYRYRGEEGRKNYTRFFDQHADDGVFAILAKQGDTTDDFQAILVLPYFHIGTEKLGLLPQSPRLLAHTFSISYSLHLPLMDVMMSRGSWKQAFAQLRINGGPLTDKIQLPNNKQLLILTDTSYHPDPDKEYLLSCSQYLGEYNGTRFHALDITALYRSERDARQQLLEIAHMQSAGDSCLGDSSFYCYGHFDTGKYTSPMFGNGAARAITGNVGIIHRAFLPAATGSRLYEFSAWVLVSNRDYKIPRFRLYFFNAADSLIKDMTVLAQEPNDSHGLWLRAARYFTMPDSCVRIETELVNIINPAYLALDELLIRPANATIIAKDSSGRIMVNNHLLRH